MPFVWQRAEQDRRGVLFPLRHPAIWERLKRIERLHWTADEVEMLSDRGQWPRLPEATRRFVLHQLAFFSRVDIDVLENLEGLLADRDDPPCLELKMAWTAAADQERVHAEAYANQIRALCDPPEAARIALASETLPVIRDLRAWALRWFGEPGAAAPPPPLGERLVAFALVEGVMFSASFCALQWLREQNALPGVTAYNDFIARDEATHADLSCLLVRDCLTERPAAATAAAIADSLVRTLDAFVADSLPAPLALGMSAESMQRYVRFQADFIMAEMGYAPPYGAANPFAWAKKLGLNGGEKKNFFEGRATEYSGVQRPEDAAFRLGAESDSE